MNQIQYFYKTHVIEQQNEAEKQMIQEFQAGEYNFEQPLVKLNPYLIAPLTALIMFRLDKPSAVKICVKGKSTEGNMCFTFPTADEHYIPVYGLYADYQNEVVLTLEDGRVTTVTIKTEAAPESIHHPEYVNTTPEYFGDNVMFVTPSSFSKLAAFDYAGDLRWYTTLDIVFDVQRLKNGRLWIATERLIQLPYYVTGIYEMGTIGKIYVEYRLPGGVHHDYTEDKNGNILILTEDFNRDTVEDMCLLLDRKTGEILKTFDFKGLLPTSVAAGNRKSEHDWMHTNAIWYDETSNSISVSARNLDAIVNIDYETGAINWILGDSNKWPQEYVDKYFFTPEEGQEEFDWFYAQHAGMILPDGDVLVFDNGAWRSKFTEQDIPAEQKFSRGVRYQLNKEKRTVRQVWQYGKERGFEFFSPHISNVNYYDEDHYMVHSGDIGQIAGVPCVKPPIFYLNKPEEKDLVYYAITTEIKDGEIVYEMKIPSNAYYRAKKIALYNENDVLSFGEGKQLGSLGITKTTRVKVPNMVQEIPEDLEVNIEDEIDRFKISMMLEVGAYACLVLANENEQQAYLIPTTEKDELAMCVGTLQPKNAGQTFITISKGGLKGNYHLYLLLEQNYYDLKLDMEI